jgi:hypothetical protein
MARERRGRNQLVDEEDEAVQSDQIDGQPVPRGDSAGVGYQAQRTRGVGAVAAGQDGGAGGLAAAGARRDLSREHGAGHRGVEQADLYWELGRRHDVEGLILEDNNRWRGDWRERDGPGVGQIHDDAVQASLQQRRSIMAS